MEKMQKLKIKCHGRFPQSRVSPRWGGYGPSVDDDDPSASRLPVRPFPSDDGGGFQLVTQDEGLMIRTNMAAAPRLGTRLCEGGHAMLCHAMGLV